MSELEAKLRALGPANYTLDSSELAKQEINGFPKLRGNIRFDECTAPRQIQDGYVIDFV